MTCHCLKCCIAENIVKKREGDAKQKQSFAEFQKERMARIENAKTLVNMLRMAARMTNDRVNWIKSRSIQLVELEKLNNIVMDALNNGRILSDKEVLGLYDDFNNIDRM